MSARIVLNVADIAELRRLLILESGGASVVRWELATPEQIGKDRGFRGTLCGVDIYCEAAAPSVDVLAVYTSLREGSR